VAKEKKLKKVKLDVQVSPIRQRRTLASLSPDPPLTDIKKLEERIEEVEDILDNCLRACGNDPNPFSPYQQLNYDDLCERWARATKERARLLDSASVGETPSFQSLDSEADELTRLINHANKGGQGFRDSLSEWLGSQATVMTLAPQNLLNWVQASKPKNRQAACAARIVVYLAQAQAALEGAVDQSNDASNRHGNRYRRVLATLIANSVALGAAMAECRFADAIGRDERSRPGKQRGGAKTKRYSEVSQQKVAQWMAGYCQKNRSKPQGAAVFFLAEKISICKEIGVDKADVEKEITAKTLSKYYKKWNCLIPGLPSVDFEMRRPNGLMEAALHSLKAKPRTRGKRNRTSRP
jgi:hypothetical protein